MTPRADTVDLGGTARPRGRGIQPRRGGNERRADAWIESVLARTAMTRLAADALLDQRAAVEGRAHHIDCPPRDGGGAEFSWRRTDVLRCRPRRGRAREASFEAPDLVAHRSRERGNVDHAHVTPAVLRQPPIDLLSLVSARPRARDRAEKAVHLRHGVVTEDAGPLPNRPSAKGRALVDHHRIALVPERSRRQDVGDRKHHLLPVIAAAFHVHASEVFASAPADQPGHSIGPGGARHWFDANETVVPTPLEYD
jgi:hypothetical protein